MNTQTKITQEVLTPQMAKQILVDGNERFVQNVKAKRNFKEQVIATSKGQFPFAVILGCIDSRVPTEIVFDQGIGDVFSARVAGNVINEDILGSMEYACKVAGSKIVVVMGHTKCGAVTAACQNVELGNITALLNKIKPAVAIVKANSEDVHKEMSSDSIE
ncbi:MAG: carbonic anhydrase, partial [Flavobacteriaceae bacterium]|nr:carbonic anhydrase [Flavobacteriaceae bacterium]